MKISKTALLTLSWMFSVAGLWLMLVSAIDLKLDPSNAVQHMGMVKIISDTTTTTATLKENSDQLVWIETEYNFVLSKTWAEENKIYGAKASSILWWRNNVISGTENSRNGNVILGWSWNYIDWTYNVILWWEWNKIQGSKMHSTILWWRGNIVKWSNSAIVWWSGNTVMWNQSVVAWSSTTVEWDNSVALWMNSHVGANNSFLWTDWTHGGKTLVAKDVFAVVWGSGMVIGTNQAHRFAQLTLNGSLVMSAGIDLSCSSDNAWTLKVVNMPTDSKICLCSCDGSGWTSMFGLGPCLNACTNWTYNKPVCGDTVTKICSWGMSMYSWECKTWKPLDWTWAYLVTKDNEVHWSCQTDDGTVVSSCSAKVNNPDKICWWCTGDEPGAYTDKWSWNPWYNKEWEYITDPNISLGACEWRCQENYERIGDTRSCQAYSCQWNYPDWVTISTVAPNNTTNWSCATDLTKACTYICPAGSQCNEAKNWCEKITYVCENLSSINTTNAHVVNGIWSSNTNVSWKLYGTDADAQWKVCSYACDSGYHLENNKCVKNTYACKNTKPTQNGWYIFTTDNPANASEEKNWTHVTDGTDQSSLNACEFTCDLTKGYYYDTTKGTCERKTDRCDNDNLWGCVIPSEAKNKDKDTTKYIWNCAIKWIVMDYWCYKCKDWYIDKWNGECVNDVQCQSEIYRSNPLPSEDQTKYKFVKMNGNYDPDSVGYNEWQYIEPDHWNDYVNSDEKWVCIWTCADGYVINDENNPTKCIPADACWPAKQYNNPRKSKSELCNEWWSLKDGKGTVTFQKNSYNTACSVLKYEWKCEAWSKVKTCSRWLVWAGVRIYSDIYLGNKITMSSTYYSESSDVNGARVEQPLTANIRYYSTYNQDRNQSQQPAYDSQKTLKLEAWYPLPWEPLPGYDVFDWRNNSIRKFIIINFDPIAYEKNGVEYIIYPKWEDGDFWYRGSYFSCPSSIDL